MTVYIGNAWGDEHGQGHGGEAGNQTGKELRIIPWYKNKKGWRVFVPKSEEVAAKLVYCMKAACNNPHIGYDQGQRNTLYNAAAKVGFDCAKVTTPCECDCSSLVRVCLAYAGIKTDNFNTASEPSVLLKTGKFTELKEHTDTSDYLKAGSILVTAVKGHTAIVLNDGPKVTPEPKPEPPKPPEPEPPSPKKRVVVIGRRVRVREKDSVLGKTLFIARKGNSYDLIDIAPSGWYHIMTTFPDAYITDKQKYTRLVEE